MNSFEKKITVLSLQYHCYPDDVGGAWGLTYEVNKRLVARGQQVHLITCKPIRIAVRLVMKRLMVLVFIVFLSKDSKGVISLWRAVRRKSEPHFEGLEKYT